MNLPINCIDLKSQSLKKQKLTNQTFLHSNLAPNINQTFGLIPINLSTANAGSKFSLNQSAVTRDRLWLTPAVVPISDRTGS